MEKQFSFSMYHFQISYSENKLRKDTGKKKKSLLKIILTYQGQEKEKKNPFPSIQTIIWIKLISGCVRKFLNK